MTVLAEPLTSRPRITRLRKLLCLWTLVLVALPLWMAFDQPGWDLAVYYNAMRSVHRGVDPYADAIAVQELIQTQRTLHPAVVEIDPPYSYVYSPITIPLLRAIGILPVWFAAALFCLFYVAAVLAQSGAGLWAADPGERPVFLYLAPLAPFFPGLLANGIVLSGNIAYLLYGAVLVAAVAAWRGASWRFFYAVVLAASCVKVPLLSLALIPALSARRQVLPAAVTLAAGVGLFALQPLLCPTLFHHYLQSIDLLLSLSREFGCSPAGLFSDVLYNHHISYARLTPLFYLAYAVPLFATLVVLARRFFAGHFPLRHWAPVLLVGVILLNPRLIEYDVAPLTLPLALIAWRFLRPLATARTAAILLTVLFLVANAIGLTGWDTRKLLDGPLLVLLFVLGVYTLLRAAPTYAQPQES